MAGSRRWRTIVVVAVALIGVVLVAVLFRLGREPAQPSTQRAGAASTQRTAPTSLTTVPPRGAGAEVKVTDAATLKAALAAARPGTTITMADGSYLGKDVRDGNPDEPGRFVASVPATATAPITLRGSRNAIVDEAAPAAATACT